jgi:uncharacterized protein YoxC
MTVEMAMMAVAISGMMVGISGMMVAILLILVAISGMKVLRGVTTEIATLKGVMKEKMAEKMRGV